MNYKFLCILLLIFAVNNTAFSQLEGCTDPQANNYNAAAIINDGSCTYNALSYSPPDRVQLPTAIREISGMTYFRGKILSLNDSGNPNYLYILDTITGAILQTITVAGATNVDWEEISQDSNYIYIGDVGNNSNGNRKNLKFYKIGKTAFLAFDAGNYTIPASAVQIINFSYSDQTNFTSSTNATRFDCEAFVIRNNKIHLFTKNWLGDYSVHYTVPIDSGTYVATRLDSFYTKELLVTGASLGGNDELLLSAYYANSSNPLSSVFALYLVYGFDHTDYFFKTGNVRKIDLPGLLTTGQMEAVCFVSPPHGFISNEYAQQIITIQNRLRTFNVLPWIIDYYKNNPRYPGEKGMVRYNSTVDKYEVFTGTYWEYLGE
jgi:hypothetical protein